MTYQPPTNQDRPVPHIPGHTHPGHTYNTLGAPITPRPKKRHPLAWIAGGLAALVLLCCGIGVAGNLGDDPDTTPAAATTTQPAATTATPATTAATTPAPKKTTPAPKPTKVSYKKLTTREWLLIAKNPDAYIGKTYVVYGVVTQFDAATGKDTFRADVGHKKMGYAFEYPTNTVLTGSESKLARIVGEDEFRASVRVLGSYSYDTQIGGNTTVPRLEIVSIKLV